LKVVIRKRKNAVKASRKAIVAKNAQAGNNSEGNSNETISA
jgi:hypothetical protein